MKHILYFDINDFKEITSMMDFYKKVGIAKNSEFIVKDVRKMTMNPEQCKLLLEFLKSNQKLQTGISRSYTPKYYESQCTFEWTMYAPSTNNEVPENEIWLDF